jgi:hypothetical protein
MQGKRPSRRSVWSLFILIALKSCVQLILADSLSVDIVNAANARFDLFWVNPDSGDRLPISEVGKGILPRKKMNVQTYVGHEFEVREIPSRITNSCANQDQVCRSATFVVIDQEPQGKWINI